MLKNGSGSVRRKVNDVFGNTLSNGDKQTLATLIYYPREKMAQILEQTNNKEDWYKITLYRLIEVSKRLPASIPDQRCARPFRRSSPM